MSEVQPRAPENVDLSEKSVGELLSTVTSDVSFILRKEVELAKLEIRESASKASKAGGMFGAAGAFGYLTLIVLAFAAGFGLATVMATWLAFLIVGVVLAVITAVFALLGRKELKEFQPVPEQTIDTLKEDAQWAKQQMK